MISAVRLAGLYLVAGGALGAAAAIVGFDVIRANEPRDALPETVATAIELIRHNLPVAVWPLALVMLGWPAIPVAREVGDALVTGQLLLHGSLVGSAFAQHPAIWRFLPHLPLEWLALAIPAAMWIDAHAGTSPSTARVTAAAAAVFALLTLAAVVETYGAPVG